MNSSFLWRLNGRSLLPLRPLTTRKKKASPGIIDVPKNVRPKFFTRPTLLSSFEKERKVNVESRVVTLGTSLVPTLPLGSTIRTLIKSSYRMVVNEPKEKVGRTLHSLRITAQVQPSAGFP